MITQTSLTKDFPEASRRISHLLHLERNKRLHFSSTALARDVYIEEITSLHRDDIHTLVHECKGVLASIECQLEEFCAQNDQTDPDAWLYRAKHKHRMVGIFGEAAQNELQFRHSKLSYERAMHKAAAEATKTERHIKHQVGQSRRAALRNKALYALVKQEIGPALFARLSERAAAIADAQWEAEEATAA